MLHKRRMESLDVSGWRSRHWGIWTRSVVYEQVGDDHFKEFSGQGFYCQWLIYTTRTFFYCECIHSISARKTARTAASLWPGPVARTSGIVPVMPVMDGDIPQSITSIMAKNKKSISHQIIASRWRAIILVDIWNGVRHLVETKSTLCTPPKRWPLMMRKGFAKEIGWSKAQCWPCQGRQTTCWTSWICMTVSNVLSVIVHHKVIQDVSNIATFRGLEKG